MPPSAQQAFGWGMGKVIHGKKFPQENLIWPSYHWRINQRQPLLRNKPNLTRRVLLQGHFIPTALCGCPGLPHKPVFTTQPGAFLYQEAWLKRTMLHLLACAIP